MKNFFISKLIVNSESREIFDVDFIEDSLPKSNLNKAYTTLIIGANGTGKSYLLAIVADIFKAAENSLNGADINIKYPKYYVKYILNSHVYELYIDKRKLTLYKNGKSIVLAPIHLPTKVLAVSFLVNDKFTFQKEATDQSGENIYEYLGVRRTSNATWTNSVSKRISENIINNFHLNKFNEQVKNILEFLGFKPKVSLVFEYERKSFPEILNNKYFHNKMDTIKKSEDFRSDKLKRTESEDLNDLLSKINKVVYKNIKNNALKYDIFLDNSNKILDLKEDYETIKLLIDLKILKSSKLVFYKEEEFDFEYASSGEKQFLFTMINIVSSIEENSLILIDEPEISLHPNWQMTYINYLKSIFKEYKGLHFLIASHSHYLVSDLEKDSSSLIIINQNSKKLTRTSELIEYSTYAWSAENILYNVFGVRTTRNHYFEMDLRKLTKMMSEKNGNKESIRTLVEKLNSYIFNENDPLNILLDEAKGYLENDK